MLGTKLTFADECTCSNNGKSDPESVDNTA